MSVLEIKEITKYYGKNKILDRFSLNIENGEIVSIIGSSGVGKSTLLRCITGLEKIENGKIIFNENLLKKNKTKIGMVFQDYNLFPQYSVLANVTLALTQICKMKKSEAEENAKELLRKMNLLNKIDCYPYQLSGGERQRLAIARTLAIDPQVICFDEPTSALDPKLVDQLFAIIKNLTNESKGILIVTHDIKFAKDISNRIIEIKR